MPLQKNLWVKQCRDSGETFGYTALPVRAFGVDTVFASSIYYILITNILYSPGVDTVGGKRGEGRIFGPPLMPQKTLAAAAAF
jgi:hypothetical protein